MSLNGMSVQYLQRPGGRIAYTLQGSGPLVVCVPGMGDLRVTFRFLAADLVAAGYRVAVMDLRGHGDSDLTFTSYDDEATAGDVLALVGELAGPGQGGTVIGNSMGGGAAVIAAAKAPDLIDRLVLVGAFVRNPRFAALMRPLMELLLARPWGRAAWRSYWRSLYPGRQPEGFEQHEAEVLASLDRPGRWKAFRATTRTSHDLAEKLLDDVRAVTLVVMGEQDPDFKDPVAEAQFAADRLHGEVLMVPEAGHYPQAEYRELVSPAVIGFLDRTHDGRAHDLSARG